MCFFNTPKAPEAQMPNFPAPAPTPVDASVQASRRASSAAAIAASSAGSGIATSPLGLPNIANTTANFKNFLGA